LLTRFICLYIFHLFLLDNNGSYMGYRSVIREDSVILSSMGIEHALFGKTTPCFI